MNDKTNAHHRNHVFLMSYTEYLYRKLLKTSDYSMQEISDLVDAYSSRKETDYFFDKFSIKFAEWAVNQKWDKTSASLGVDDSGNNIAKSTKDLLWDFKQELQDTDL